ncbi:ABC-F family ATP-binding cassette domain-containing protein [Breznakiellaceae bacterium SP9]
MAFIQFSKISLAFGDRDIFKDLSFNLAGGSRSCLAGANGSGKSTLMKVIAGTLAADSGSRAIQKGCRISYLPQSGITHTGRVLRDEAETAFAAVIAQIARQEDIGRQLEAYQANAPHTTPLLEEFNRIQEYVETSGYYSREQEIAAVLKGLGFSEKDLERRTDEFSGGWQMRIALAKVLLEKADILLLDEPTNYLDIEARDWLENWLHSFTGGYLLVSHDRYFLDVSCNEVWELFAGTLKRYVGNYSSYEKTRRQELESLVKRFNAQQEEIAKTEDLIRRFRYKASKAAMVQERIKMLEKMERIEIPESLKRISITFPQPPHSGRIALRLEGVSKSYGTQQVLSGLDLLIESGEHLAVVGRNGAGKTTLLRILSGRDPGFTGSLQYGAGIAVGYFSQDEAALIMKGNTQTVLSYLESEAPTPLIPQLRNMLGAFLFPGDAVYKSISVLSGGELSRLALLKMLLKPINLLILDEPTNHLDLHSKDVLLSTLKAYTGTIIFVSHDRGFLEELSTKTLELSGLGPRLFYGNYAYYLEKTGVSAQENDLASEQSAAPVKQARVSEKREAQKQQQTLIRRLERQEAEILETLEQWEVQKASLEAELSRPEVYSNGEKAKSVQHSITELSAQLAAKSSEWEAKAAELEAARRQ